MGALYFPGTLLINLHVLFNLLLTTILGGKLLLFLYFIDNKSEM